MNLTFDKIWPTFVQNVVWILTYLFENDMKENESDVTSAIDAPVVIAIEIVNELLNNSESND